MTTAQADPATRTDPPAPTALPMMQPVLRRGRSYSTGSCCPVTKTRPGCRRCWTRRLSRGSPGW